MFRQALVITALSLYNFTKFRKHVETYKFVSKPEASNRQRPLKSTLQRSPGFVGKCLSFCTAQLPVDCLTRWQVTSRNKLPDSQSQAIYMKTVGKLSYAFSVPECPSDIGTVWSQGLQDQWEGQCPVRVFVAILVVQYSVSFCKVTVLLVFVAILVVQYSVSFCTVTVLVVFSCFCSTIRIISCIPLKQTGTSVPLQDFSLQSCQYPCL